MSQTGKKDRAYPRSNEDKSTNGGGLTRALGFRVLGFCGAVGGYVCPVVLGATQYVYSIPVSKFIVYNRSLLLQNSLFGVDIYTDGGADPFCPNTVNVRQDWWLGFSDDGVMTDLEVKGQGNQFNAELPYQIEILGNKLPQPILLDGSPNPNWDNKIYVHVVWNSALYVQPTAMFENILKVAKHNYDIKI